MLTFHNVMALVPYFEWGGQLILVLLDRFLL